MSRRAVWRGTLVFGKFRFEAKLYSALSSAEKISFHIVNRKTGNRVERQFVDSETESSVERDSQVRGYKLDDGNYVMVEDEALKALMPESDKTLTVTKMLTCDEIDKLYFDKPYYLAPAEDKDEDDFRQLTHALEKNQAAAFAEAVLFRRNRAVLIRPHEGTLIATTLDYDYEVRSAANAFKALSEPDYDEELLELAGHIIDKRMARFVPSDYQDRYNDALRELVEAKLEGREIKAPKRVKEDNVVNLRDALRQSAEQEDKPKKKSGSSGGGSRKKAS